MATAASISPMILEIAIDPTRPSLWKTFSAFRRSIQVMLIVMMIVIKTITVCSMLPSETYSITVEIAPGPAIMGMPMGMTPSISFSSDSCFSLSVDLVPGVSP